MINFEEIRETKDRKIAIHFNSKKEEQEFLKECEKCGIDWLSGAIASEKSFFDKYNGDECLNIDDYFSITHERKQYFLDHNFSIIEYKELRKKDIPEKKYTKKDIEKVVNDIRNTIKNSNWKVEKVYIYKQNCGLAGFVHFAGQGLLQFIYDDLKKRRKKHTYNWQDVTSIFKSEEPFTKKQAINVLCEELKEEEK